MESFLSFASYIILNKILYYHKNISFNMTSQQSTVVDKDIQRRLNMEYYKKLFIPILVNDEFEIVNLDGTMKNDTY